MSVEMAQPDDAAHSNGPIGMYKELFGVFGDCSTFERFRSPDEFTTVIEHEQCTIGIRDPDVGTHGWSSVHSTENGVCVIFGESYAPDSVEQAPAAWLFDQFAEYGRAGLSDLNGSYLAFIARGDEATVATDPIRSRECFYTDTNGVRIFGSDAATVGRALPQPEARTDAISEYLYLGVALGEKTCLTDLHRLPADSLLRSNNVEQLERFVYDEQTFDYATELGERLERAIQRRAGLPGRKGLLLSAGYDSRLFLPTISDLAESFTVGAHDAQEVTGARRVSSQFGVSHTAFDPDRRYLLADDRKVRYSQGIKESLHIHHAGYTAEMDVDTLYHGLLCDTMFRGHFTAEDGYDVRGVRIPRNRPDPDPNPITSLLGKFGYDRAASQFLAEHTDLEDDPERFARRAVAREFEKAWDRADSMHNALNACGIGNQPSIPFHTHITDHFRGSFLATDIELLDWHLKTPPRYRTTETFLEACRLIDPSVLRHDPPDRPHGSRLLNEVERFVRQHIPGLTPFDPPWPDRNEVFDRYDLNQELIPDCPHLHDGLAARQKLRVNDVLGWSRQCSPEAASETEALLHVKGQ